MSNRHRRMCFAPQSFMHWYLQERTAHLFRRRYKRLLSMGALRCSGLVWGGVFVSSFKT